MKRKLTILILSFNRPTFLLRFLKFLEGYDAFFELIILDSSQHVFTNKKLLKIIKKKNIKIKIFPSEIAIANKIQKGLKLVETEFSVICACDDFYFPKTLLECVKFLEKNSNYSSAHGLYFQHTSFERTLQDGISLSPIYIYGPKNEEEKMSDRVNLYLTGERHYYPFYAVHRTADLRYIWQETAIYADNWAFIEIFPSALSFILGKMKVLPTIYASRDVSDYTNKLLQRIESDFTSKNILDVSNRIAKIMSKYPNIYFEHQKDKLINSFNNLKTRIVKKNKRCVEIKRLEDKNTFLKNLKKLLIINAKFLINFTGINGNHLILSFRYNIKKSNLKELELSILENMIPDNELGTLYKESMHK